MTAREVLRGARALLADPARWAKKGFAKDADGRPTGIFSEDACSWCLLGALRKTAGDGPDNLPHYYDAVSQASLACDRVLYRFNDDSTHAQVLSLIDAAIAREEGPC